MVQKKKKDDSRIAMPPKKLRGKQKARDDEDEDFEAGGAARRARERSSRRLSQSQPDLPSSQRLLAHDVRHHAEQRGKRAREQEEDPEGAAAFRVDDAQRKRSTYQRNSGHQRERQNAWLAQLPEERLQERQDAVAEAVSLHR